MNEFPQWVVPSLLDAKKMNIDLMLFQRGSKRCDNVPSDALFDGALVAGDLREQSITTLVVLPPGEIVFIGVYGVGMVSMVWWFSVTSAGLHEFFVCLFLLLLALLVVPRTVSSQQQ